ncbi:MAG: class I SAM-dependent methyltransferase [Pseudomonadota bacterium]|nr:class I SAM-dependent methyltransferase [Pseudomonadota bacterium]
MKNKFLIKIIAVSGFTFLIGSAFTHIDIFPGSFLKRGFNKIGLVGKNNTYTGPIRYTGSSVEAQKDQTIPGDTSSQGLLTEPLAWRSPHLQATLNVPAGVFDPYEAEWTVLRVMEHNPNLFDQKRVMEIGTGSGIISLYAAKLGASNVVATDINPKAIESITTNALDMGYGNQIDARLVSLDDLGAYSVIGENEKFDVIVSNPPFALDLDAPGNDAVTDTGDLGFSIIRGLKKHLAPGGIVILLYDSLFYHQVMVRFAKYEGYNVRNNHPNGMYGWEAESLFNGYMQRLLKKENVPEDAFPFNYHKDEGLEIRYLRNSGLDPKTFPFQPLFDPPSPQSYYAGFIVIRN